MEAPQLRRGIIGIALAIAMLSVPVPAHAADEARPSARKSVTLRTDIDLAERGRRIAPNFLGFSYEYRDLPVRIGHRFTGVNPVFVGLYDNFTDSGSGVPVLRVGGGSQDETWWNPTLKPRPTGLHYDLTQEWIDALAAFEARTRAPLILGLNLVQERGVAVDMARAFMAGLPRSSIRSFELGNEPDIYFRRPIGFVDGRTVFARPRNYRSDDYLREIGKYLVALRRLRPRPPISGPAASCTPEWCEDTLEALLRRQGRRLDELTFHTYATSACAKEPGDPGYEESLRTRATIPLLLSNSAFRFIPQYQTAVRLARRHRLPVRVSETNSAVCGGAPGVSDTFASALWGADWMFALAANGVSGVNFHASSATYAPFTTGMVDGKFLGNARPLYYGMLLFSRATARRARVLINPTLGMRSSVPSNMRLWATLERRRRTLRVVVINKEHARRSNVRITIPGSRRAGSVVRLQAPALDASEGVSLAGQSVAIPTEDGELLGQREEQPVRPRRGVYRFSVPAGSAAMLTVERVPRAKRKRARRSAAN